MTGMLLRAAAQGDQATPLPLPTPCSARRL